MSTDLPKIKRQCWGMGVFGPHAWEPLNPVTLEPFRRGRVVFLCRGDH